MLPLQLALAPANDSRGGGGGGKIKGGRGEKGGKVGRNRMPAAVRETALMCVTVAVRACGSRFVEVSKGASGFLAHSTVICS